MTSSIKYLSLTNRNKTIGEKAFTLIELLTVMAIIVVLAGLVVGAASIIQNKAARARAQSEIAGMGTAITSYETDNGTVPRNSTDTDKLDARTIPEPDACKAASLVLYKLLSGNFFANQSNALTRWATGNTEHPDRPKAYYDFKPNQLAGTSLVVTNGRITDPNAVTNIIDPFGLTYGYSTIYQASLETNATATPTKGFNPTYDLWSTAGYGSGKPYPTNMATADKPNVWVKNWN